MAQGTPNYTYLKSTHRDYELWAAAGPRYIPRVYTLTDGDAGQGHIITSFVPVPVLGPPLRVVALGDTLFIYGGDSYVRGGGAATGHSWAVYRYDAPADDNYLAQRGATITGGITTADSGQTLVLTPTTADGWTEGVYAIELHLAGADEGDGITAPLGFGVRFVYVSPKDADGFWNGQFPLVGTQQISGGLDNTGWSMPLRQFMPDDVALLLSQSPVPLYQNSRFAIRYETYYDGTKYTWEPDNGFPPGYYDNTILISGYVDQKSAKQASLDQSLDFTVTGSQRLLQLLQMPTVPKNVPGTTQGSPNELEEIPTDFISQYWYDLLIAPMIASIPDMAWVHQVAGMRYSDPMYHMITRHSNFADFNDFRLWQQDDDIVEEVVTGTADFLSWMKQISDARMGIIWSDRKGKFYLGPDLNLRGQDYWASAPGIADPVITFDGDLYNDLQVSIPQPTLGQVVLRSVDSRTVLEQLVRKRFKLGPTPTFQDFIRAQRKAIYPTKWISGRRMEKQSMVFFEQEKLDELARRLFASERNPMIINVTCPGLPGLDLAQPVLVEFSSRSTDEDVVWPDGLLFYVIGYSITIEADGSGIVTNYTLRLITDPPTEE